MNDRTPIQGESCYCPLCDALFPRSQYLRTVFTDPRQEWCANMVTHYRHHHVVYYNHSVGYHSWNGSYDAFKHQVNERAKRQVIRKAKRYLRELGVTADDWDALEGEDPKTRALALRMLGGSPARAPSRPAPRAAATRARVDGELVTLARESAQLRIDVFLEVRS